MPTFIKIIIQYDFSVKIPVPRIFIEFPSNEQALTFYAKIKNNQRLKIEGNILMILFKK